MCNVKTHYVILDGLIMAMSMFCMTISADEVGDPSEVDPYCEYVPSEEGELTAEEIIANTMDDSELDESDNILAQAMAEEMSGDNLIDPQWLANPSNPGNENSDHASIIKCIRKYLGDDYTEADKDQIMEILTFSVNIADDSLFHTRKNSEGKDVTQLHAVRDNNYLADLKILWKYSKLVTTHTIAETETMIRNSMSKLNDEETEDMEIMFDSILDLYAVYKSENNLNRVLTKRERKYLPMGFALHLIGDIYAHATLVPKNYAISDPANNPYFKLEDFKSLSAFKDCMTKIGSFGGTDYFRCTDFRSYLWDKDNANKYYEDNKSFMPQRVKLAQYASIKFISRIHTSGQTFSTDYVFRHYETSEGTVYDVTLSNFNDLASRV